MTQGAWDAYSNFRKEEIADQVSSQVNNNASSAKSQIDQSVQSLPTNPTQSYNQASGAVTAANGAQDGASYVKTLFSNNTGLQKVYAPPAQQTANTATNYVASGIAKNTKALNNASDTVTGQSNQVAGTKAPDLKIFKTSQALAGGNQTLFDQSKKFEQLGGTLKAPTQQTQQSQAAVHDSTANIATNTAHSWGNVDQVASGVTAQSQKTIDGQLNKGDYTGAVNTATATGDIQRQAGIAADNAQQAADYLKPGTNTPGNPRDAQRQRDAQGAVNTANQNFIGTTKNTVPVLVKGNGAARDGSSQFKDKTQSATVPQDIVDNATHARGLSESANGLTADLQRIGADPRLQQGKVPGVPKAITTAQDNTANALTSADTAADTAFTPIVNGQINGIQDAANTVNTDYRTWSADPTNEAKKQALLTSIGKWQNATQGGYYAGGDTFSPNAKGAALNQLTDGYLSQLDPGLRGYLSDPLQHSASDVANMPTLTRQANEAVYRYQNDPAATGAQQTLDKLNQQMTQLKSRHAPQSEIDALNKKITAQQGIVDQGFAPVSTAFGNEAQGLLKQNNLDGNGGLTPQQRDQMQALMLQNHRLSNPTNDYQRAMASLVNGVWNPPSGPNGGPSQQGGAPGGPDKQKQGQPGNPFQGVADLYNQWNNQPDQFWANHGQNLVDAGLDFVGQGLVGVSNAAHIPIDGFFDSAMRAGQQAQQDGRNAAKAGGYDKEAAFQFNDWLTSVHAAGANAALNGTKHFLDTVTSLPGFFGNIASTVGNQQERQANQDTASAFTNALDGQNIANLNAMRAQRGLPPVNSAPWDNHLVNTALGYGAAAFTNLGSDQSTTPQKVYDQYAHGFQTDPGGTAGGIVGDILGMHALARAHAKPDLASDALQPETGANGPDVHDTNALQTDPSKPLVTDTTAGADHSNPASALLTRPSTAESIALPDQSQSLPPANAPEEQQHTATTAVPPADVTNAKSTATPGLTDPKGRPLPAESVAGADGVQTRKPQGSIYPSEVQGHPVELSPDGRLTSDGKQVIAHDVPLELRNAPLGSRSNSVLADLPVQVDEHGQPFVEGAEPGERLPVTQAHGQWLVNNEPVSFGYGDPLSPPQSSEAVPQEPSLPQAPVDGSGEQDAAGAAAPPSDTAAGMKPGAATPPAGGDLPPEKPTSQGPVPDPSSGSNGEPGYFDDQYVHSNLPENHLMQPEQQAQRAAGYPLQVGGRPVEVRPDGSLAADGHYLVAHNVPLEVPNGLVGGRPNSVLADLPIQLDEQGKPFVEGADPGQRLPMTLGDDGQWQVNGEPVSLGQGDSLPAPEAPPKVAPREEPSPPDGPRSLGKGGKPAAFNPKGPVKMAWPYKAGLAIADMLTPRKSPVIDVMKDLDRQMRNLRNSSALKGDQFRHARGAIDDYLWNGDPDTSHLQSLLDATNPRDGTKPLLNDQQRGVVRGAMQVANLLKDPNAPLMPDSYRPEPYVDRLTSFVGGLENVLGDIHYHYKGYDHRAGENMMTTVAKLGKNARTLFGSIPQWCGVPHYNDINAPRLRMDDAAKADDRVANNWLSMFKKDPRLAAQADLSTTGMNPSLVPDANKPTAAQYLRDLVTRYPGVFRTLGEFTINKEGVRLKLGDEAVDLNGQQFHDLASTAQELGIGMLIHNEWGDHGINDADGRPSAAQSDYGYFHDYVNKMKQFPDLNLVGAHSGVGRFSRPVYDMLSEKWPHLAPGSMVLPEGAALPANIPGVDPATYKWDGKTPLPEGAKLDNGYMVSDGNYVYNTGAGDMPVHAAMTRYFLDALPHANIDLSWNDVQDAFQAKPEMRRAMADVVLDHPGRVLYGSDSVKPATSAQMLQSFTTGMDMLHDVLADPERGKEAAYQYLRGAYNRVMDKAQSATTDWARNNLADSHPDRLAEMEQREGVLQPLRQELNDGARADFDNWYDKMMQNGAKRSSTPPADGAYKSPFNDTPPPIDPWRHLAQQDGTGTAAGKAGDWANRVRGGVASGLTGLAAAGGTALLQPLLHGLPIVGGKNLSPWSFITRGIGQEANTFMSELARKDWEQGGEQGIYSDKSLNRFTNMFNKYANGAGIPIDRRLALARLTDQFRNNLAQIYAKPLSEFSSSLGDTEEAQKQQKFNAVESEVGRLMSGAERALGFQPSSYKLFDNRTVPGQVLRGVNLGTLGNNIASNMNYFMDPSHMRFDTPLHSAASLAALGTQGLFGLFNSGLFATNAAELGSGLTKGNLMSNTPWLRNLQAGATAGLAGTSIPWALNDALQAAAYNPTPTGAATAALKMILDGAYGYNAAKVAQNAFSKEIPGQVKGPVAFANPQYAMWGALIARELLEIFGPQNPQPQAQPSKDKQTSPR